MRPLDVVVVTNCHIRPDTGSSTAAIVAVGLGRGHKVCITAPGDIARGTNFPGGVVGAVQTVEAVEPPTRLVIKPEQPRRQPMTAFDVVLMRAQPPVDLPYVDTCTILATCERDTLFVNSPSGIVLNPEKMFPLAFPDLHPPTVLSASVNELVTFVESVGKSVLKPLNRFRGEGVRLLYPGRNATVVALTKATASGVIPVIVQMFLPEVEQGDKRLFLVDGKPVASLLRIPPKGSFIASLHAGAKPIAATVNRRDEEIVARIGPALARARLPFVAVDVVGGYLIEIGTTSPTGLVQTQQVTGIRVGDHLWNWIEREVAVRK